MKKKSSRPWRNNSQFSILNSQFFSGGFTLIELLIVIVIIGILATVFVSNYSGVRQRERDSERKSDLRQIQTALELYNYDQGIYPVSLPGCSGNLTFGSATYMQKIPCDPLASATYYNNGNYYYTAPGGTSYTLCACLENANDSQGGINSTCGTLAFSAPVISSPLPRLGLFSRLANLIQGSVNLGKREVSGLFSKLAVLIPKFGDRGQAPRQEVAAATVVTISTDFDGDVKVLDTPCGDTNTNTTLRLEESFPLYRIYIRFPLGAIPAGSIITNAVLTYRVITGGPVSSALQAYNQNGQADPGLDTCSARSTRTADDTTPYFSSFDLAGTAGLKTLTLPAGALSDIQSANDTVDRFSLALNESGFAEQTGFLEAIEAAGVDEPKLTITYSPPSIPTPTPTPIPIPSCNTGKFFVLESQ